MCPLKPSFSGFTNVLKSKKNDISPNFSNLSSENCLYLVLINFKHSAIASKYARKRCRASIFSGAVGLRIFLLRLELVGISKMRRKNVI